MHIYVYTTIVIFIIIQFIRTRKAYRRCDFIFTLRLTRCDDDFDVYGMQGVVPATTGVVRGRLTVGLSQNEIETLGRWVSKGSTAPGSGAVTTHHYPMDPVVKVSRRDFPFALAHVREC